MDIYVLDTSALISNPNVFKQYPGKTVVIPIAVISELDSLKKRPGDTGKNARVCIRTIDKISGLGDIDTGIELDNGALLKIDINYAGLTSDYAKYGPLDYGDTKILVNALALQGDLDVTLVSNDLDLRIKAKAFGLNAESCDASTESDIEFCGLYERTSIMLGNRLNDEGWIDPGTLQGGLGEAMRLNEFVLFNNKKGAGISMGRKWSDDEIIKINSHKPWGLSSRNKEQACAIDLLMDPEVKLVTLLGVAGTGKSLITLAAALEQVIEKKTYKRMYIYRPIEAVGKELGFLPGTEQEKIEPYFQNINDSFEFLLRNQKSWKKDLQMWKENEKINFAPITYIRGRSINNALMIIDEAQNLSAADLKTVLTRVGVNTKVILTGDIAQIDNDTLDILNNGLSFVIDKFKDSDLSGTLTLVKGERSELAEEATKLL